MLSSAEPLEAFAHTKSTDSMCVIVMLQVNVKSFLCSWKVTEICESVIMDKLSKISRNPNRFDPYTYVTHAVNLNGFCESDCYFIITDCVIDMNVRLI
jgi:hypothetical protein